MFESATTPEGPDDFYVPTAYRENINDTEIFHSVNGSRGPQETDSAGADLLIGSIAIVLTVLGVMGNTFSALYFRRGQGKSVHHLFYSVISTCDVLTSAATFPAIASLLSSRSPVLFGHSWICASWPVFYYLVFRVSMLSIVLLSLTRTISIVSPLTAIKHYANKMLYGVALYAVLLLTIDIVFLSVKWIEYQYYKHLSLCEVVAVLSDEAGIAQEFAVPSRVYSILFQMELLVPCLVVFVSFLASLVFLLKRKPVQYTHINSKNEKKFWRVSVTIALYTALFLVCYLPCFLLQALYFISMFYPLPEVLSDKEFRLYGHLVSQFLLPLLNSAVSPCLYFWRMSQYREWLREVVEDPSRILIRSKYSRVGSTYSKMGSSVISKMGSSSMSRVRYKESLRGPSTTDTTTSTL